MKIRAKRESGLTAVWLEWDPPVYAWGISIVLISLIFMLSITVGVARQPLTCFIACETRNLLCT